MPRDEPARPWFLSPFFADHLERRCADEEQRRLATYFREHGYLVLNEHFPPELTERIVAETRDLHDDAVPDGPRSRIRVQDAWRDRESVRRLAWVRR